MVSILRIKNLQVALLRIFLQLFQRADWRQLAKADILSIRHDSDCGQMINGKYYSPLTDSILDEVRHCSILTVAKPYSFRVRSRSYAGALSFNGAFLREAVVNRLRSRLGLKPQETGINTWREIIKTVRPRYLISIQPSPALCRACHEEGVFVFDVQHGYIGPNNPGYGEEFQFGRDRLEMADCILCWDEESAGSIRSWTSRKQIELRVIGNPWLNKFVTRRDGDQVINFFERRRITAQKESVRPRILVSLQWGLDDPEIVPDQTLFDNEFMPIALEQVILSSQARYEWILRPHPVQYVSSVVFRRLMEYVAKKFGTGVSVSENEPLPYVLSSVELHITYNSSVVIEAEYFGVPSALLDPQIAGGLWAGYYSSQINKGIAKLLPCQESAIQNWIRESCVASWAKPRAPAVPQAYQELLQDLQSI